MAVTKKNKIEDLTTKDFRVYFPFTTKDVACSDCGTMPCTCVDSEAGRIITIQGWANFCKDSGSEDVYVDHCGDVMVPEGFDLTVWNANPQILWQHDRSYTIGKGLQATKKTEGLEITAEIHEKAMEDQDFYKIDQGLVTMFSVGFRTLAGEWKKIGDRDVFFITKSLLYEVSVVSIPMNAASQFTRIKSLDDGSFYAGEIDRTPESLPAVDGVIKNYLDGEDTMKIRLRDILPEEKVKELEELGLTADLDALKDVDTKSFIEALIAKQFGVLKTELIALVAEATKTAEVVAEVKTDEEKPASEEEPPAEDAASPAAEEEPPAAEEEKAEDVEAIKSLSESIAALTALAKAE